MLNFSLFLLRHDELQATPKKRKESILLFLWGDKLYCSNSLVKFFKDLGTLIRAGFLLESGFLMNRCWSLIGPGLGRSRADCDLAVGGITVVVAEGKANEEVV